VMGAHMNEDLLPLLAALAISPMKDASPPNGRFRLFISSAPSSSLPLSLLDVATTIAIDAPQRLRTQLQVTLASLDEGVWSCPDGMLPSMWSDVLVALVLFHSVTLQRRKFGPLGWNVPYDFTLADLTSLLAIARHCIPAAPGAGANGNNGIAAVDWAALRRAASAVAYGGRVTDDEDATLLATLVNHVMRPGNGAASRVGSSGTCSDHVAQALRGAEALVRSSLEDPVSLGFGAGADVNLQMQVQADPCTMALHLRRR
jgi:dynein heavy chain, axonemal